MVVQCYISFIGKQLLKKYDLVIIDQGTLVKLVVVML